jgi:hypothetical protein
LDLKTKAKDPSYESQTRYHQIPLEDKEDICSRTYQFLDDSLGQVGEVQPLGRLRIVDVLAQDSDGLSIGVSLESVTTLLKDKLDLLVYKVCVDQLLNWLNRIGVLLTVGDDTVCSTVKCILAHCSHCFLKLMPGSKRLTVDQTELVGSVTGVRVTVGRARLTVSSPSSVSHRSLSDKSLGHVDDSDVGRLLSVRSSSLVGRLVGI